MSTKYGNPKVSFDGKCWYLPVGIDLGIKNLVICSDGITVPNINKTKIVKRLEKRLRRLQGKVTKKYILNSKGEKFVKTSNITKLEKDIRLLQRRLSNIRNNHLHQATTKIVETKPSKVTMVDLNIQGMMKNKHLSKKI